MDGRIGRSQVRLAARLAGVAAAGVIVSGCVAAQASPTLEPTTAPTAALTAVPSPSPAATASPSPTFAPLPSGAWTGIHWTRVTSDAPVFSPLVTPGPSADPNVLDSGWVVTGWSRGYVAFDTVVTDGPTSWSDATTTQLSEDGVTWRAGGGFTLSGTGDDPYGGMGVTGIVEGPSGLVAVAAAVVTCGNPGIYVSPVAVSADGTAWKTVTRPANSIQRLTGSAHGYLAVGGSGVFTSTDGAAWSKTDLSAAAFKGLQALQDGVAFGGGYVIVGVTKGPAFEGCGAGPTSLNPATWLSADGSTWAKSSLPGAVTGPDVSVSVCVVNDRVLVASESVDNAAKTWTSADGATWTAAHHDFDCNLTKGAGTAPDGRTLRWGYDDNGVMVVSTIGDDLSTAALAQSGDVPDWTTIGESAFGPAGLIATDQDNEVWIGVPTAS